MQWHPDPTLTRIEWKCEAARHYSNYNERFTIQLDQSAEYVTATAISTLPHAVSQQCNGSGVGHRIAGHEVAAEHRVDAKEREHVDGNAGAGNRFQRGAIGKRGLTWVVANDLFERMRTCLPDADQLRPRDNESVPPRWN